MELNGCNFFSLKYFFLFRSNSIFFEAVLINYETSIWVRKAFMVLGDKKVSFINLEYLYDEQLWMHALWMITSVTQKLWGKTHFYLKKKTFSYENLLEMNACTFYRCHKFNNVSSISPLISKIVSKTLYIIYIMYIRYKIRKTGKIKSDVNFK